MNAPRKPDLTGLQLARLDAARATLDADPASLAEGIDPGNQALVYGVAFGAVRAHLAELVKAVDELTGGAAS